MGERPVRLQLSRKTGFDLQAMSMATNGLPAVKVDRSTMWGNSAAVRAGIPRGALAVEAFQQWVDTEASWAWKGRVPIDLRGRNLACWCKPGEPCHADVLLELSNPTSRDGGRG